ncbi:hypothetical protein LSH36_433g01019 [Paralvinella palmiformis]|uniref:Adenomatous polyposis coli N-terminal dimerisation domain-containing protein n=1 Tax=Paralvinella palmiformis TaxID=53620 RepID=A0AAD9JCN9_9ANNE|nr:hypothetical protein LSH36_433g01019 [Paralvinella palmiformis]
MSLSSYDNLLRQVESLKQETCNLQQELQDNSSHLTKLESDACTMKNVLSHIDTAMDEEDPMCDTCSETSSIQGGDILSVDNYQHTQKRAALENSTDSLDQNSNASADDTIQDQLWKQLPETENQNEVIIGMNQNLSTSQTDDNNAVDSEVESCSESDSPPSADSPPQSPKGVVSENETAKDNNKEIYSLLDSLDKERWIAARVEYDERPWLTGISQSLPQPCHRWLALHGQDIPDCVCFVVCYHHEPIPIAWLWYYTGTSTVDVRDVISIHREVDRTALVIGGEVIISLCVCVCILPSPCVGVGPKAANKSPSSAVSDRFVVSRKRVEKIQEQQQQAQQQQPNTMASKEPAGYISLKIEIQNNVQLVQMFTCTVALLEALDRARSSLLQEIENEDQHKKWYYEQLESLEEKIQNLPNNYNIEADMNRRHLEFEMKHIESLMLENLGTTEQMAQRHEARLQRVRMIETEMINIQRRHQQQDKIARHRPPPIVRVLSVARRRIIDPRSLPATAYSRCCLGNISRKLESFPRHFNSARCSMQPCVRRMVGNVWAIVRLRVETFSMFSVFVLEEKKAALTKEVEADCEDNKSLPGSHHVSRSASEVNFVEASYHELQGDLPQGAILYNGPNGSKLVTIATQTAEQLLHAEAATNTYQSDSGRQSSTHNFASLYHGAWPIHNGITSDGNLATIANQDTASVMSFHSNNTSSTAFSHAGQHQLGTKVEMVYSLLSMLGTHDKDDMSRTLLAMSSSQDSCIAMRQSGSLDALLCADRRGFFSGCLPLLVQLLHGNDKDSGLLGNTRGSKAARARAAAALHNIVHSHPDDKRGRREARVLRLLEQIRAHCDQLRGCSADEDESGKASQSGMADIDHHPGPAIAALMKLSFDEEHRHAICTLGGLQAIAELLQLDHEVNSGTLEQYNITMRRYACMALTNLTFGDGTNKALLCSMKSAMEALVAQLKSPSEDLRQVAASVLRNLSWRADLASKKTLREVGSVTALMLAAMEVTKESTLKSILSALWNMSAHCSENKADICAVDGALAFLVTMLTFKSPSKTLSIIENGGGILRNVSSHIAVREDYRKILRQHSCLHILLKHLRSPSLTIVSNACGTLWNLSARCLEDQKSLWEMGAVSMLRNLVHSKHKMISMGSAAALKNLLSARHNLGHIEGDHLMPTNRPGLHVRKQKALETEIDQNLSETCENLESPTGSPTETRKHDPAKHKFLLNTDPRYGFPHSESERRLQLRGKMFTRGSSADNSPLIEHRLHSPSRGVTRSGSEDSVGSTHSDISHDRGRIPTFVTRKMCFSQEQQEDFRQISHKVETIPYEGLEQSNYSHSAGGRIMQVMQEVVQHAEHGECNMDSVYHNGDVSNSASLPRPMVNGLESGKPFNGQVDVFGKSNDKTMSLMYQNKLNTSATGQASMLLHGDRITYNSQRMESLHLDLPEQDEPINYSMKYSSEPQRSEKKIKRGKASAFIRPKPKVQNFMTGTDTTPYSNQVANSVPAHSKDFSKKTDMAEDSKNYSGYAETDLDHENVDQPTDYSIRYMEQDDEIHTSDQPINYSTRFSEDEPVADGERKSRRQANIQEPAMLDEDTVRTFCTEGTPLTYLSTATSMNDLTAKVEREESSSHSKPKDSQPSPKDQNKSNQYNGSRYPDSEKMSGTGTQSTDRNTSSTVIIRNQSNETSTLVINNHLTPPKSSPAQTSSSHPPSLYSYNDSTCTSSPSDKLQAYCTEDTPVSFSRRSSLSSLHSSEAVQLNNKADITLHDVSNTDKMDLSSADVTLKPELQGDSFGSANTSGDGCNSGQTKTVTFHENNQVQETPLMFSRCSSLGSLSSFDSHSVHSSVLSEYSRRASEVVSPSELPDSPSDTMPPSPSQRKSPVSFEEGQLPKMDRKCDKVDKHKEEKQMKLDTIPEVAELSRPLDLHKPKAVHHDDVCTYAEEGTPSEGNFSTTTSLSALTFDNEPEIQKDPGLRRVPLGQETDPEPLLSTDSKKVAISTNDNDEDDDNSSVSEGEENLLAEFISLAMPSSSKKKIKKSSSDGFIDQKQTSKNVPCQKHTTDSRILTSASSGSLDKNVSHIPLPSSKLQRIITKQDEVLGGQDSPRRFVTEGTPLNYSRAESLSDLSMDSHDGNGINKTIDTVVAIQNQCEDNSDVSSISDDEMLLSEAIQAAMPKGKKQKVNRSLMDRTAEGCDSEHQHKYSQHPTKVSHSDVTQMVQQKGSIHQNIISDSVKTFATEGTPISLSHATSLSDLTVDEVLQAADGASEDGHMESKQAVKCNINTTSTVQPEKENSMDSMKLYGVEGTPAAFSRNDSLSSLSCDEEIFEELVGNKTNLADELQQSENQQKKIKRPNKRTSPRKPDPETAALARLKTPGKLVPYGPNSTSTPLPKKAVSPHFHEDQPEMYTTEDTPMHFSRNSSLSSLGITENDHQRQWHEQNVEVYETKDESTDDKVEDAPINLSGNGSVSSLSVESLSFEVTPSESALLEECINAALPKSKRKKKQSPSHHTSPNSDVEANASKKSASRMELFKETKEPSKNGEGPQAETRSKTQADVEQTYDKATVNEESKPTAEVGDNKPKNSDVLYLDGEEEDGSDVDPDYEDQKLIEAIQQVETKVANFGFKSEEPPLNEVCLEARQIPKHSPHKNSDLMRISQLKSGCLNRGLEFSNPSLDLDLMKESFPDMSSSLVSNVTTPDVDDLSHNVHYMDQRSANTTISSSSLANDTMITVINANDTIREYDDAEQDAENKQSVEKDDTDAALSNLEACPQDEEMEEEEHEMSMEEQKQLEENVNIVLSEISLKRDMTSSLVDDEMFIENETISLVSNDYTSDTASEASVSLSSSIKSVSGRGSEMSSSATLSSNSNATRVINKPKIVVAPGPRIVKPVTKEMLMQQKQKEQPAPKAIRGGKKLASAAIRGVTSSPAARSNTANTTPPKVVRGNAQKPKTPLAGAGRGVIQSGEKKLPIRNSPIRPGAGRGIPRVNSALSGQLKPSPPTRSSSTPPKYTKVGGSPKPSPVSTRRSSSAGRQITPPKTTSTSNQASSIPKPGQRNTARSQSANKSLRDKSVEGCEVVERPSPPVKQGTFTKDSPTSNTPMVTAEISVDVTDHNGNKSGETAEPTSEKKPGTKLNKSKGTSDLPKLGVVKTTDKISSSPAQRQSPSRKTDSDRKSQLNKGSGSQNGSRTSLNKTSSGSSLNKTNSSSSLNKGLANSRTPPKQTDVTRRGSAGNNSGSRLGTPQSRIGTPGMRSSLPTARSTTPASQAASRPATVVPSQVPSPVPVTEPSNVKVQKKQAVSKIAGLWKKDNKKSDSNSQVASKDKPTSCEEPEGTKSSRGSLKRLSKLGKSKKNPSKDLSVEIPDDLANGSLKRSSTYDKLIPDTPEVANQAHEATSSTDNGSTPSLQSLTTTADDGQKMLWRRTYTVGSEEERSSESLAMEDSSGNDEIVKPGKQKKDKRHSLSLWRHSSQEDDKQNDKDKTKMAPPKKKGFSLWRRDPVVKTKTANKPAMVNNNSEEPAENRSRRPEPPKRLEGSSLPVAAVKSTPNSRPLITDSKVGVISVGSPLTSPNKPPNAAIVAPFNYNPNRESLGGNTATTTPTSTTTDASTAANCTIGDSAQNQDDNSSSTARHITKTEMLIARRQTYLNNLNSAKNEASDGNCEPKTTCLVTTV